MPILPSPFVSVAWLQSNYDSVAVVDARWYLPKHQRDGRREFEAGHLPGGIYVDLSTDLADLSSPLRNALPKPAQAQRRLGELGLPADRAVVVYDAIGFSACRVAWLLDWLGQAEVAVLDGGIDGWRDAGGALESGPSKVDSVSREPAPCRQRARIAQVEEVLQTCSGQRQGLIVDAREASRFLGPDGAADSGHMPGAKNLHYRSLFSQGARLRPPAERRAQLEALGLLGSTPVIASCGSGVTACNILWALRAEGREDAALYDGSWDEWQRDPSRPVIRETT